jgi:hypothetical protein
MVKGYIAGTRKEHYRQTQEEDEQKRKDETANSGAKSKNPPIDSDTDNMPHSSASTKSGKSNAQVSRGKEAGSTSPRSSSSSKYGKTTKRATATDSRNDKPPWKKRLTQRSSENTNSGGTQRGCESLTFSDNEPGPSARKTSKLKDASGSARGADNDNDNVDEDNDNELSDAN